MVTQKYIAEQLGVSQSAVACALHPTLQRHISSDNRRAILNLAERLGYVPHHAARRLIRSRFPASARQFDHVGLIVVIPASQDVDTVGLAMMGGAERELSNHQACLTFVRVGEGNDWKKIDRLTRAGIIDAWLLYGAVDDDVVNRLASEDHPVVVLGDHRCTRRLPRASIDNGAIGRLAAQHLASLGHRRVGYINGPTPFVYPHEMLAGFRAAVAELGMDNDERLIAWCGHDGAVKWLRGLESKPTALFAPECNLALYLQRQLKEAGIDVPGDISIVGCEPYSQGARIENFTRVELPMSEVGRQGAILLHRLASEPESDPGEIEINVTPALVEGWTRARLVTDTAVCRRAGFGRALAKVFLEENNEPVHS